MMTRVLYNDYFMIILQVVILRTRLSHDPDASILATGDHDNAATVSAGAPESSTSFDCCSVQRFEDMNILQDYEHIRK